MKLLSVIPRPTTNVRVPTTFTAANDGESLTICYLTLAFSFYQTTEYSSYDFCTLRRQADRRDSHLTACLRPPLLTSSSGRIDLIHIHHPVQAQYQRSVTAHHTTHDWYLGAPPLTTLLTSHLLSHSIPLGLTCFP